MSSVRHEQSLGELFSELAHETRTLIRQEVQLAKTELSESTKTATKDVSEIAIGGAILYAGLLALLAAAIIGLGVLIGFGWSALLVGLVVTGIGAVMVMSGSKELKSDEVKLDTTQRALKETKAWAKEQTR